MGIGVFGRPLFAAAASLLASFAAWPAHAASDSYKGGAPDFYKGRTVQVIVGFSPGGGYDLYARVLARHLGKHIPGNPTVVTQNMPGAGSLKAANYLYNVAPKDGTVFGTFDRGLPMERLLGRTDGERFDATKFTWIGSVTDEPSVCAFSAKSGIRSWQDMKTKPFKVGGAGATADDEIYPNVLRNMFHVPLARRLGLPGPRRDGAFHAARRDRRPLRLVLVEPDQPRQIFARQKRGHCGSPARRREESRSARRAAYWRFDRRSEAEGGAEADLLAPDHCTPLRGPSGLGPGRTKALREAFDATMKDPEFLAEMKKLALDVRPQSGVHVEQLVREVYTYPADVVKIAAEAILPAR